jgi:hypothetical protein
MSSYTGEFAGLNGSNISNNKNSKNDFFEFDDGIGVILILMRGWIQPRTPNLFDSATAVLAEHRNDSGPAS